MRLVDRLTAPWRRWLREYEQAGGNPDSDEARWVKTKIAQAEEGAADDAAVGRKVSNQDRDPASREET